MSKSKRTEYVLSFDKVLSDKEFAEAKKADKKAKKKVTYYLEHIGHNDVDITYNKSRAKVFTSEDAVKQALHNPVFVRQSKGYDFKKRVLD